MASFHGGSRPAAPEAAHPGDEVAFLKQHAPGPFKVTLPSPITLAGLGAWFKPG